MESHTKKRPQLLTVDDEPNILKSLRRTLRRCDIDVTVANSGKAALEIMADQQFDVIMTDMRMPQMNGAEFLTEAYRQQPDSKRILLTGYADFKSTVEAINHGGVTTYLSKPWDDNHLIQVIEEAVQIKKLTAQNELLEEITKRQNEELKALNAGLELKVEERTRDIRKTSVMLEQAVEDLTRSYETMVSLLSTTASLRDKAGCEYNEQKRNLASELADLAGLDAHEKKSVEQATELHRIGLLSLPDSILQKPYQELTKNQQARFNQHPEYAEATLMGVAELNDAALFIRHQSEKWDGTGYPDGKIKDSIPMGSRILALSRDYYDLLAGLKTSKKFTSAGALKYVEKKSGTTYDPELVPLLFRAAGKFQADSTPNVSVKLDVARLQPGMALASDLKSGEGMMLLRKDQILTEPLIRKIANLARTSDASFQVSVRGD